MVEIRNLVVFPLILSWMGLPNNTPGLPDYITNLIVDREWLIFHDTFTSTTTTITTGKDFISGTDLPLIRLTESDLVLWEAYVIRFNRRDLVVPRGLSSVTLIEPLTPYLSSVPVGRLQVMCLVSISYVPTNCLVSDFTSGTQVPFISKIRNIENVYG